MINSDTFRDNNVVMRIFLFIILCSLIVNPSFSQIVSTDSLTTGQFLVDSENIVNVTYIANDGFLISSGSTKVEFDGIFSNAYGLYHTPTAQTLTKERGATSPFDNLAVLLVSHKHDDHVNSAYVAEHMGNDVSSVLICPSQVNTLMQSTTNYNTIKSRVTTITPAYNTVVDTVVKEISFKIISLQHPNDASKQMENIGFIFSINEPRRAT